MLQAIRRFQVRLRRLFVPRFAALLALLFASFTLGTGNAFAQDRQIVTDATLNDALIAFEGSFPQYVAEHPALTSGSAGSITLQGTKGKIRFTFAMEGQYTIDYGTLAFSPTDPISADRFVTTLNVDSIIHAGSADMTITRKGKTYDLDCPNNSFSVRSGVFTCQVQVLSDGGVTVTNPRVTLDPKSIVVSVPCLQRSSKMADAAEADDVSLEGAEFDISEEDLGPELQKAVVQMLATQPPPGNNPSGSTLNRTSQALTSSAQNANSSVAQATTSTIATAGTAAAASGTSPCGGTLQTDVAAIVTDLEAISAQAQVQGFPEAMDALVTDLETIVPTLSAPNQALVEEFIADLEAAVSETGPGGTSITHAEEAVLELDLFNVILSTGITSEQSTTIVNDILTVVSTVEGISTAQLQADVAKFLADAQACGQ